MHHFKKFVILVSNFLLIKFIINIILIIKYDVNCSDFKIINNYFDFSFSSSLNANQTLCFPNITTTFDKENNKTCLSRKAYSNLLPCKIGIKPNDENKEHILVVGSTGVLGVAIVSELKKYNFTVAEIKSHFQFDINSDRTYLMLENINISIAILIANNDTWNLKQFNLTIFFSFCVKKKIKVIQIVKNFDYTALSKHFNIDLYQIQVGSVFGPIFLTPFQQYPSKYLYDCLVGNPIMPEEDIKESVFSLDVSQFIIYFIKTKLKTPYQKSKIIKFVSPKLPTISSIDIKTYLFEKKCKFGYSFLENKNIARPIENRKKIEIAWTQTILNSKRNDVYSSLIFVVTNSNRIIHLFPISLQSMDMFIKLYPNISIEIIILYCPLTTFDQGKFYEIFSCPENLKRYIKIIEIPPAYLEKRKQIFNITYLPEFDIKNIGIRRALGEYIFSSNSDVIFPISFYECIQRRLFTSLTYYRTQRQMTRYKDPKHFYNNYRDQIYYFKQMYTDPCRNQRYYDEYERNGCGDFQGAHKYMWYLIHGFIESDHVFHIDTALSMDFTAIVRPYMSINVIGINLHLAHPKYSRYTNHFQFYATWLKNGVRQGFPSYMISNYSRIFWGTPNQTFQQY